jgi:hypothetical protein
VGTEAAEQTLNRQGLLQRRHSEHCSEEYSEETGETAVVICSYEL